MSDTYSRQIMTLKNLCFDTVFKHFEEFCVAYNSNESQIPERHFEFLQRKYTKTLTKLLQQKDSNEKYLKFLINKHVKEFDLEYFNSYNWSHLEERLLAIGDTLVKLKLTGFMEPMEEIIRHTSNLEVLEIENTMCNNSTLTLIQKHCKFLKELNVSMCSNITNEGLKNLFQTDTNFLNTTLLYLNLQYTFVTEEGVALVLEHVPSLEVLKYDKVPHALYNMYKDTINNLALLDGHKTYNLTSLEFSYYYGPLGKILALCTKLCPQVKNLTVGLSTPYDLKICSEFSKLESISFSTNRKSPHISINSFLEETGIRLRNVDITGFILSTPLLKRYCSKLETLSLNDVTFEEVDEVNNAHLNGVTFKESEVKTLHLNHLHSFRFEGADFSDENTLISILLILADSPNLVILHLPYCNFNFNHDLFDIPVSFLKCINTLREIDLSFSNITIHLLETIISSCSLLENLNIQVCHNIDETDYISLLKNLEKTKLKLKT